MKPQQLLDDLKHISKERMLNRRTEKQADESMLKVIEAAFKSHAVEFAQFTWKPLGVLEAEVYDNWITPK